MGNTTYFLGAGASAGKTKVDEQGEHHLTGIPIVKNTLISFHSFKQQIRYELGNNRLGLTGSAITDEAIKKNYPFYEYLLEIENELTYHGTFDTIARKYWLMGKDTELNRLKFVMNIFFIWLQNSNNIDKRYDRFLSIILNKNINGVDLPSNFRFITWNYDIQFELAMLSYMEKAVQLDSVFDKLSIIPFGNNKYDKTKFHYVKLNGTAGIFDKINNSTPLGLIYDADSESIPNKISYVKDRINAYTIPNLIDFILKRQENINNFDTGTLQFAFENLRKQKNAIEAAIQIIKETSKLIIIGYSFPYFNREIDVAILKELPKNAEIIIENIDPPTEILKDIFKRQYNRKTEITTETDVSQFHIPFDFQHGKFFPERNESPKLEIRVGNQIA